MTKATIVPGPFASVSSGNCTNSWMLDGDDIQARADAAMNPHFGNHSTVGRRGVEGYGIQIEGSPYIVDVYASREVAERKLAESHP